ncbi:MAG: glycosyltransferase [Anaerolineales bacterium]|nr:glycosyltransferase [Anaerolineales bacterium]
MTTETSPAGAGLRGEQIVHFAQGPWHDIWRNRQHIFSRLARDNTVLYVEPKVHWLADLRRGRVKSEAWRRPRLVPEADGLWLYRHPVWAPRTERPGLDGLTRGLRRLALRRAMAQLGIERPITWVFQVKDAELIGSLDERLIVCYVDDEYAAYRHHTPEMRQRILREEPRLLARAHLVIVTSRKLLESKAPYNPQTVFVPNGVDFAAFERAWQAGLPVPEDIRRLPRPIIGYSGHISLRLDLPLLAEIARQRPTWSLALVGSVWEPGAEAELASLRALPNVYFLGQKPAEQVPYYLPTFDVGLIPYRPGEEAQNINPIKLYEYLAAGIPIVSVDIPALEEYGQYVRIAGSPEDFLVGVEAALQDRGAGQVEARRRLAAENTWDQRVQQISALVQARLRAVN